MVMVVLKAKSKNYLIGKTFPANRKQFRRKLITTPAINRLGFELNYDGNG